MTYYYVVCFILPSLLLYLLSLLLGDAMRMADSSSLTNEKGHHYFLNSADVCW